MKDIVARAARTMRCGLLSCRCCEWRDERPYRIAKAVAKEMAEEADIDRTNEKFGRRVE